MEKHIIHDSDIININKCNNNGRYLRCEVLVCSRMRIDNNRNIILFRLKITMTINNEVIQFIPQIEH